MNKNLLVIFLTILSAKVFSQDLKTNVENEVIIPFHLVDGFILIDGQVNKVKGKFLLDTGTPFDFFLNNEKIQLDTTSVIGEGAASSGQKIIVHKSNELLLIAIEGIAKKVRKTENFHTKLNFVSNGIGLNIIGFIGYGFLKDYEFSINYNKQLISLLPIDDKGKTIGKKKDKLLNNNSTIYFSNINDINIPEVKVTVCNQIMPAYFDTGSRGSISISEELRNSLFLKNCIDESIGFHYGTKQDSITTIQLNSVSIQEKKLGEIDNLLVKKGETQLTLGYSFLKKYISVWNYKKRTIDLFEN